MSDIGLYGLGVMGRSLVLNMESKGNTVSVYDRHEDSTRQFVQTHPAKRLIATFSIEKFVSSIQRPRKIFLMVKAGSPVDEVIGQLKPFLEAGDLIIDGGNSYYQDTIRRIEDLKETGIGFLGAGVSGGEEGALKGPSIMPGGDKDAYDKAKKILQSISAKVDGQPCCEYMGPGGAGHFIKMVHNGIEYADMQLISEAYTIMRDLLEFDNTKISQVFTQWNKGKLNSYLIEITADIFQRKDDEASGWLVDKVLDCAAQKGTGNWTARSAGDLAVPVPTIAEAVNARALSMQKANRLKASKLFPKEKHNLDLGDKNQIVNKLENALYAAKICSYAQGFDLIKQASTQYNWNTDLGLAAKIWRSGCIIRAKFLDLIANAYKNNPNLENLVFDEYFASSIKDSISDWRYISGLSLQSGIYAAAMFSALEYFDGLTTETLGANLLQAQRDYFGAHTYKRIDKEGVFHSNWK